jgi:hypothetical protein
VKREGDHVTSEGRFLRGITTERRHTVYDVVFNPDLVHPIAEDRSPWLRQGTCDYPPAPGGVVVPARAAAEAAGIEAGGEGVGGHLVG